MTELLSGNEELFTPERSPVTGPPTSPRDSPPQNPRTFVIEPPLLAPALKNTYKISSDTSLKPEGNLKVDEVIGEYPVDGVLYYFARYAGGIAYKVGVYLCPTCSYGILTRLAVSFALIFTVFWRACGEIQCAFRKRALHTAHLHVTEQKKSAGDLPPFDPSASYVHPLSRVTMVLNFSKRYGTTVSVSSARSASSVDAEVVSDSQDEDDEYDESDMLAAPRRSGRSTARAKQVLPFSPRKTRSRRILVIDSDQEPTDSDEAEPRRPIRRSTRSKKGVKVNLDAETYSDNLESEGETSDNYSSRELSKAKSKKPKKVVRRKAARPAYGHFRSVADLSDDFSDDENREHRDICEKCHRVPAHTLLEALKKKSKVQGKKKRKTSDDEFEVRDDEESFTALGGWVRWWGYHFSSWALITIPLQPQVSCCSPLALSGSNSAG